MNITIPSWIKMFLISACLLHQRKLRNSTLLAGCPELYCTGTDICSKNRWTTLSYCLTALDRKHQLPSKSRKRNNSTSSDCYIIFLNSQPIPSFRCALRTSVRKDAPRLLASQLSTISSNRYRGTSSRSKQRSYLKIDFASAS